MTNTSWPESITWNTRPAIDGPALATPGAVTLNQVVEVDVTAAVGGARERIGHAHRIAAEVSAKAEIKEAIDAGAAVLIFRDVDEREIKDLIDHARRLSDSLTVEVSGDITLDNVRHYAESGADLIRVAALTQSVRAMSINFQIQMA